MRKRGSLLRRLKRLFNPVQHDATSPERPWRLLQVESALACNLRCIMCPWQQIASQSGPEAIMAPEVWQALRPHLKNITSIDFTGGGEPLLQPLLAQWIQEAHAAGCETGILTNGLLLDDNRSRELLEAGIDWICVSMDAATPDLYHRIRRGSDFDRVCGNVQTLAQLRKGRHPKLMINFVLMTVNIEEIEAMVALAAQLGVDQLNFKQCDVIRGKYGRNLGLFAPQSDKQIRQLEQRVSQARKMADKQKLKTTSFAFLPSELPVCAQDPRNSMFVRYDGTIAPCINLAVGGRTTFLGQAVTMPQVQYGRLPNRDLADIWDAKPCRFYRRLFESRKAAYDKVYMEGMMRATSSLERLEQNAKNAMPEAPKGCRYCHYLYDI